MSSRIDVTFDVRLDTPGYPETDPDPDKLSPTLRRYHKLLWSKALPSGELFDLTDTEPGVYLYHRSTLGEFWLASDAVVPTFRNESQLSGIMEQIPDEVASFVSLSYTVGGMMLFPANRIDGQMTLNGTRGFHPRIKDRFDLTVECIRRHYVGDDSPLSDVIRRYEGFFSLFRDFRGYVEFFLLQDLVTDDCGAVKFFSPFENFATRPVPASLEAYRAYRKLAMEFLEARNGRITRCSAGA